MSKGPHGHRGAYTGKGPKDFKGTVGRILEYLKKYKIGLFVVFISTILGTIFNLAIPYVFSITIDRYILSINYKGIILMSGVIIALGALAGLFSWLQSYIMASIAQKTVKDIRQDAFDNLQNLSLRYYDSNSSGDIMSRLTNDIELISSALSQAVVQLISSGITVIGAVIMMFVANWRLALITIIFVPVMGIFTVFITKKTFKNFKAQQQHLASLNGIVEESIGGLKAIKLYNQEDDIIDKFQKKNEELKNVAFKAQLYSGVIMPVINFINNLVYVIIVVSGGYFAIRFNAVSVGQIAAVSAYSRQFTRPISQLAQLFNTLQQSVAGAERVFEVMDKEDEYVNDNDFIVEKVEGHVEFKNVYFGYEKDKTILKDISFEANVGEVIAIVGPTGSGKTTIINLINRFYDVDQGQILIDGHDITDINKDSLRKRIGVVLQDTNLFGGTVFDNIRYGKRNSTKKEVIEASKLANADGFISRLPKGYNTEISEGGENFSQGERQLISIARTILSNPDILILDEATSNVDTRTESHIQESMEYLMEGRTSFVIAHRLQTIRNSDKILVIKDGEIIEHGNHRKLLDEKGFYYDLYTTQFKGKA
ncbi:ABC transporter ATP-binding protein [Clostridium sp. D2Q-11]|uniref:ABC transporter ATP-binding protein n=1 Tax=Anaeromonas frigoriresistens TaxID=2683708 RepID=A0A942Z9E1_9FIRM|nr:ABC transporter ATP-binding protein [Anaeromonas frigoriresistens]MBS4539034.1 ABC transporter ATP-binding protein [Anaeromonas frigoriresistens]